MKIVLTARHWQIFIFIFIMPYFISSIFVINIFIWLWFLASFQSKIPEELQMKDNFFVASIILILVCFFVDYAIDTNLGNSLFNKIFPDSEKFIFSFSIVFVGLPCVFYCMNFVAKTIKMAELQRRVVFSEYLIEFFSIWFYPVGVWFLQPKINKMVNK